MRKKVIDWKDEASTYYPKSLSLAILMILFSFLVSPKMEVKPYQHKVKEMESVYIPPEIKDVIKPPAAQKTPTVVTLIMEGDDSNDDEDIDIVDTIEETTLDVTKIEEAPDTDLPSIYFVAEKQPLPIKQVAPEYPDFVKKMNVEGTVWLQCVVDKNGNVGKIDVLKSVLPQLDDEAKKALKKWKFQPAESGGKPVAVWVKLPFEFKLRN